MGVTSSWDYEVADLLITKKSLVRGEGCAFFGAIWTGTVSPSLLRAAEQSEARSETTHALDETRGQRADLSIRIWKGLPAVPDKFDFTSQSLSQVFADLLGLLEDYRHSAIFTRLGIATLLTSSTRTMSISNVNGP